MKKVNSLVLCRNEYKNQEEFENELKKAVMLLLDAGYIMTVRYDVNDKSMGIVVIDYDYADREYGFPYPNWLTPEEEESVKYKDEND